MTIAEIRKVCFVGAGTMGCANSLVAAISGYKVIIYDVSEENLSRVPAIHKEMTAYLLATGYCSEEDAIAGLARVSCTTDLATAVAEADLVSESVFEDLALKRKVHKQLDGACPAKTILTTNTSALLVSDLEDVVERGERFAALHTHLGSPLVDIVGGPRTSHATIDVLTRYVLSTKGVPLVLRHENKGYVLNAMLGPVLTTALILVIDGAASMQDVDRAWMRTNSAAMGPFGLMDQFGLNLIHDSWRHRQPDPAGDVLAPKILTFVEPYIERGDLGARAGRGFYQYPEPEYAEPEFLAGDSDTSVARYAMTSSLIGNAILLAANDVLPPAEIDQAWTVGMSLEKGPFAILDEMGSDAFIALLESPASALPPEQAEQAARYLRQQQELKNAD